jgi:hypothetical protein
MKSVLINYATLNYKKAQDLNSRTGLAAGGFDDVWMYSLDSISEEFRKENSFILNQKKGGGYWLWKPYIIQDALSKLDDGDVVVYADSVSTFINSFKPVIDECAEGIGVLGFELESHHTNSIWTKGDCFFHMKADDYKDLPQIMASFVVMTKNEFSFKFLENWLGFCRWDLVITDAPSFLQDDFEDFKDHRHDQSIFSLCGRRYGIDIHPDVTQWGVKSGAILAEDQLIYHHRSKLV